jgi:hypothetical protein
MRKTRQVKRSRRRTRRVKRSRRTRQVKRSRRVRRVKRSRRKIKGGAFPVIGLGALALLGAGSVAAKKLMDRSKSPEPLTNDDMQRYSDVSSYGTGLGERYEPSPTDVAIANSKRRWAKEEAEYERAAVEEKRRAAEEKRTAVKEKRRAVEKRTAVKEKRRAVEKRTVVKEKRRAVVAEEAVEEKRTAVEETRRSAGEKRRAMVAEEAAEEAVEKERREANWLRRHEIYVASERKRKQDHHDKEQIRIQALISRDLMKDAARVAASKVERVPVRPIVFKKVKDMNTQEMHDAAYFIAEDKRIKDEIAARPENAMSWNPFSY